MISIPSIFIAVFGLTIFFFLLNAFNQKKKPYRPPSPFKLPIIGNLHQLSSLPHQSLWAFSQKYGPLMLLHMGLTPTLIVSTKDAAEEIMKTHDLIFSGRPSSLMAKKLMYGKDIAFAACGEYWRSMKKISVLQLLSVKRVESFRFVREEEVKNMVEQIVSSSSLGAVNLSELLISLANDITCRVAFGRKYFQDGSDASKRFGKLLEEFSTLLGTFCVGDFIPPLAWISRWSGLNERAERNSRDWDDLFDGILKDHENGEKQTGNTDKVKDFVDVLIQIQKDNTLGFEFTKDHIKAVILDMFIAGTDTTSSAIEWMMTELLKNPKVMKKAREEVSKVGKGKSMITEDELHQMFYLKAIIKESLRLHPPIPLLVPRESTQSIKIYGYDIPAKTRVVINAWAIGRDPESWEEQENFQPERFMSGGSKSEVDFKGRDFELIPFGAGRRGCPGIHFATSTIELALANLLYRFEWKVADGQDLDMEERPGFIMPRKSPLLLFGKPQFA